MTSTEREIAANWQAFIDWDVEYYARRHPAGAQMPAETFKALVKVLDYAMRDEAKNYQECLDNDENPTNHIYIDLKNLSDWVEACLARE